MLGLASLAVLHLPQPQSTRNRARYPKLSLLKFAFQVQTSDSWSTSLALLLPAPSPQPSSTGLSCCWDPFPSPGSPVQNCAVTSSLDYCDVSSGVISLVSPTPISPEKSSPDCPLFCRFYPDPTRTHCPTPPPASSRGPEPMTAP